MVQPIELGPIDPPAIGIFPADDFDGVQHQKAISVELKRPVGRREFKVLFPAGTRIMSSNLPTGGEWLVEIVVPYQGFESRLEFAEECGGDHPTLIHCFTGGRETSVNKVAAANDQVGLEGIHEFGGPIQPCRGILFSHRMAIGQKTEAQWLEAGIQRNTPQNGWDEHLGCNNRSETCEKIPTTQTGRWETLYRHGHGHISVLSED